MMASHTRRLDLEGATLELLHAEMSDHALLGAYLMPR